MGRRAAASGAGLLFPADREAADREAERLAAELVQHDRMRIHEADLSPPDMAGQSCWAIETTMGLRWGDDGPARVLDPTCGAGIFPAAARAQWPHAEIVGCEARAEEEPHVAHNCDRYAMGDFFAAPAELVAPESFDLIITNPPFSLIVELLPRCLELVRPGGLVAFVCRLTWGDKPEADRLWRPPFAVSTFEFAGRWRFRTGINPKTSKPYGVDSVGYRLLVWRREERPANQRVLSIDGGRLDPLPAACRRWRKTRGGLWVKPGTEYMHEGDLEALPPVPWRSAA